MQTIYIRNGERFNINRAEQTIDGQVVTERAIREDMAKYGISEILIEDRKDDRFYSIKELQAAPYIEQTPKPLEPLKDQFVAQIKQTANSLLSNSDWKVTREAEGVKPCDQATKDYRAAVRSASNINELAVRAVTTVDELQSAVAALSWPIDPFISVTR